MSRHESHDRHGTGDPTRAWATEPSQSQDELPWMVAPTSVPPDTTASEPPLTITEPGQLPSLAQPDTTAVLEAVVVPDSTAEHPVVRLSGASGDLGGLPPEDPTVMLSYDPDRSAARGVRRRKGSGARHAIANAVTVGIAKVTYPQRGAAQPAAEGSTEAPKTSTRQAPKGPAPLLSHYNGNGSIIAVFAILGLLVCGGIGAMYVIPKDNKPAVARPAPSETTSVSPSASPSPSPSSESPSPSPSVSPSTTPPKPTPTKSASKSPTPSPTPSPKNVDVMTAKVGECFVDQGTANDPDMRRVNCQSGSLVVLRRYDGTSDMARCDRVAGTTNRFFFSSTGSQGFVLCMRKI